MMWSIRYLVVLSFLIWKPSVAKRNWQEDDVSIELEAGVSYQNSHGTKWAVLIAGSSGFGNYRHQADVCHAYQLLRKGGLDEKHIVVFMYDDIANHPDNPRPGTLINHPQGKDIYEGVPKDYTGNNVTVDNFFAVILGDRSRIRGGSGKVIDSGPNDHIFIYYSDHGGPGVLGMPTPPNMYAIDFVEVLKQKHAAGTFEEMVIYLEACESGSIFEGLLPDGINIYATTASNAEENSWGTYCPGMFPPPPPEYGTCLGDLYSVAWMEDSDIHNLRRETLRDQYFLVKDRTSNHNTYQAGSHVMQYGNIRMNTEHLSRYLGFNPSNENATLPGLWYGPNKFSQGINQRDADLLYLWQKYHQARDGSMQKEHARKRILDVLDWRKHLDKSVDLLSKLLFGANAGPAVAKEVRTSGGPLVDDWNCLKNSVSVFEASCGPLMQYGMKHMRAFANFCNVGITADVIASVSSELCTETSFEGYGSSLLRDFQHHGNGLNRALGAQ